MNFADTFAACRNNGFLRLIIAIAIILLNGNFVRQAYDKYYNHSNIKAYEDRMNNLYDQTN